MSITRWTIAPRISLPAACAGTTGRCATWCGSILDDNGYAYRELSDDVWAAEVAALLANDNVVGLCQGRMEFGPRALG